MKLLVGYLGKGNFGDEIILQQYLKENTDEKYIVYSYGLDYSNKNIVEVVKWKKSRLSNIFLFINRLLKCDEVEWIGGTCFSDEDGVGGFNYMIIALLALKKINYPAL